MTKTKGVNPPATQALEPPTKGKHALEPPIDYECCAKFRTAGGQGVSPQCSAFFSAYKEKKAFIYVVAVRIGLVFVKAGIGFTGATGEEPG